MKEACERAGRPGRWTSQGHQEPEFFYVYVPPSLAPVSGKMVTESPAVMARQEERNGKEKMVPSGPSTYQRAFFVNFSLTKKTQKQYKTKKQTKNIATSSYADAKRRLGNRIC